MGHRPFLATLLCLLASGAHAAPPAAVEKIVVRAKAAPGAGLIAPQNAPVARSTVGAAFIATQAPSASAFDLLRLAPGANTASTDPYGLSPGTNIAVRGLNGDEVAYLVEGAPLNDVGYYAGYPSQWVDAENLASVSLQPGTADLDTPTINAAGGLISLSLRDPAPAAGGDAAVSYGSYHEHRVFLRADSGLLPGTHWRGLLSYSDTAADNYRGAGHDRRQHVDAKLVDEWGDGNRIALAGSWHDAILSAYPMPALQDWQAFGRSVNYDASFSPGDTNYWKLYQQSWHDEQVSAPSRFTLGDGVALETTPYFEHGFGNSPYGAILPDTGLYQGTQPVRLATPPASGQALVLADYIGNQYRAGITSSIVVTAGAHRIVAGWWYDYADDYDPQPFTPVSPGGEPASVWGFPDTIRLSDGRTLSAQEAHTREQANVLFLGDTWTLDGGRLTLDAGLKYAMVNREGTNGLPGPQYRVGLDSAQPLPRAAMRYRLAPDTQLFASVSTNFRSPTEYALYDTYDVFGDLLTKGAAQHDEYSISEEIGIRLQRAALTAALSLFNYNFTNRQVATLIGSTIGSSINAGGQTSRGVDAELGLRVARVWRPYLSAEYLHATIDNDFPVDGVRLATAGKTAVRSPAFQGAAALAYDDGTAFANVSVKYTGAQYATFINDERIASHAQADAALGVRLPDHAFLHRPEIRLNLINVTDAKFLSGVAAVQPAAHGVAGAAPSYYVGPGFAAVLTLSSAF